MMNANIQSELGGIGEVLGTYFGSVRNRNVTEISQIESKFPFLEQHRVGVDQAIHTDRLRNRVTAGLAGTTAGTSIYLLAEASRLPTESVLVLLGLAIVTTSGAIVGEILQKASEQKYINQASRQNVLASV